MSTKTESPTASGEANGSIFEMECCPLCGGKSGFNYRLTIRGQQSRSWKGGDSDPYFEDRESKHGAYRCDDCGKIIKSNGAGELRLPDSDARKDT